MTRGGSSLFCGGSHQWAMVCRACATPFAHGVGSYKNDPLCLIQDLKGSNR
jgi:hypothetical protein